MNAEIWKFVTSADMFHTRISDVLQGKLLQLTYDVIFDQSKKDKTSFADFVVMDFAAFFPVSAKTYFFDSS